LGFPELYDLMSELYGVDALGEGMLTVKMSRTPCPSVCVPHCILVLVVVRSQEVR